MGLKRKGEMFVILNLWSKSDFGFSVVLLHIKKKKARK